MPTSRPFTYNNGAPIAGTEQVGNLAVGFPTSGFSSTGKVWWNGPDEDAGYVIAKVNSTGNQPTPVPQNALRLSDTYKATDIVLSNNNQTATQVFSYTQSVLGDSLLDVNGKVMFSVIYTSTNPSVGVGSHVIGLGNTSMNYDGPFNGYPGNDANSVGFSDDGIYYYNGGSVIGGLPEWTSGDVIDIAVDNDNGYCWIRVNGGDWNGQSATPTGTGLPLFSISSIRACLCPSIYGTMQILNYPVYGRPSGYTFLGNVTSNIGFSRTNGFDDNEFIAIAENLLSGSTFNNAVEASDALTTNGFWNSYLSPILYLDAGNTSSYPGTGTIWTDLIGGKIFNLINGPGYESLNGGRIGFNTGFGHYVECSTSLPDLNTWSVGVWHYYTGTNTGGNPCIVTEVYPGSTGRINYSIGNNNGGFSSGFFNGGWQVTDGYSLTPGNWYFIAGTYDGTTVKLYINNTLVDSTPYIGTPISSQGGIRLMRRWDDVDYWGGYLSIVGIYDKALNASQIESIWNLNKNRFGL